MKNEKKAGKRENGFLYRIRNRQFQKLFWKNWIQVFLCIVLPLVLCGGVIQYFSTKSLLREVDSAARRSTSNTMATFEALFDEVCESLEKKVADESFIAFFQMERTEPKKYAYVAAVNSVLGQINADYRENLFDSVDVYSQTGDYVISSPHKAQAYERFADKSLVETFLECLEEGSRQVLFAAPRFAYRGEGQLPGRVITIYWAYNTGTGDRAFVSASLDAEKLISYITDKHDSFQGAYLIVDRDNSL